MKLMLKKEAKRRRNAARQRSSAALDDDNDNNVGEPERECVRRYRLARTSRARLVFVVAFLVILLALNEYN